MHRKNMQEFLVLFPKPCCKSKKYSKLPFPVLAASIIKVTLSLVTSTFDLFFQKIKKLTYLNYVPLQDYVVEIDII